MRIEVSIPKLMYFRNDNIVAAKTRDKLLLAYYNNLKANVFESSGLTSLEEPCKFSDRILTQSTLRQKLKPLNNIYKSIKLNAQK